MKSFPLLDHISDLSHSDSVLKLSGFVSEFVLTSNPKGLKKSRFSPKGPTTPKNLRCETLYISDYENVNISSFAVLGIKLWLEEDGDFNRNDPLYSFKFIQSKVQN